jgi:hypothetical protein
VHFWFWSPFVPVSLFTKTVYFTTLSCLVGSCYLFETSQTFCFLVRTFKILDVLYVSLPRATRQHIRARMLYIYIYLQNFDVRKHVYVEGPRIILFLILIRTVLYSMDAEVHGMHTLATYTHACIHWVTHTYGHAHTVNSDTRQFHWSNTFTLAA